MMQVVTIVVASSLLASINIADAADIVWTTPSGGDGSASEPENNAAGAAVVTVVATPSTGNTIGDYTLLTTGTPFSLSTGGALTVTAANTLDYETTEKYVLSIKVVDDAPSSSTATLTVSVTDANDAPTFSAPAFYACANDETAAGTSVYAIPGSDQDSGDTLSYSITDGNTNTDFAIVGSELRTAKVLDMDTTAVYALEVEVDDSTATATTIIAVQVKDSCSSATAVVMSLLTILTALVVSLN
ncbi:protocadherin beta-16-like [Mercenaria mercenaria]|uniref:protocadherin beta-16-like n=1 Tax=Mercenaria mercenaria TaxID=6596 RepID=UPI00234E5B75|nr:protocadherin beta-16-like [Mercenaria mercenaria]